MIEIAVQRQNEHRIVRHEKRFRRDVHALCRQAVDLVGESPRIDDNAVADDRKLSGPDHAGRQEAQLEGRAVDDEGVARIVAALEAHDDLGARRQPVDDLAFALVAPLGADYCDIRHDPSRPAPLQLPARTGHGR